MDSNIIIASTPYDDTAEAIRCITKLVLEGKLHEVNAYVAAPEDVVRGVIHGVDPGTPYEELLANLRVRTQGAELLQGRMLGQTKTAAITFRALIIPRCVIY